MPLPMPSASQAVAPLLADDSLCRVKHVVPTGAVFAAAIERLNRRSAMALFQELAQELDAHARRLADASCGPRDVSQLRIELNSFLVLLRQTAEQHQAEVALVRQRLAEMQEQGAQAQADFERHLSVLIGTQLDQHLARAIAAARTEYEKCAADVPERGLKPIAARFTVKLGERRGNAACLIVCLLMLLLLGGLFALGAYVACRASLPACGTAASSKSTVSVAGHAAVVGTSLLPAQTESSAAGSALAASNSDAASPARSPVAGEDPQTSRASFVRESSLAAPATARAERLAAPLALSSYALQPDTMEADLLELLRRPGLRAPHTFTMDRLRYPSASHEVNSDGKEQIFLVAQILRTYPSVRIEIRGHSDGTESEIYAGPKPIPGYSLSQLRANCVMMRLQGLKVPVNRMRIRGQGATQPVADDRTAEGRQQNRRVEIVVLPN